MVRKTGEEEGDTKALLEITRNKNNFEALENELNKQGLGSGQNTLDR
jgi:hypothetical protein